MHITRVRYWIATLVEFSIYQGFAQVFTSLAGLLIVQSLSKQDYALYAVAGGMQSVYNALAEIGILFGVISIGGRVFADRDRFGQLMNTALGLRFRLALVSVAVCTPVVMWLLLKNGASVLTACLLSGVMIATLFPQLGASIWQISPQLHSQFRRLQTLELSSALLRLAFIGSLMITHINAVLASAAALLGNWLRAVFLRRWASEKANPDAGINAEDKRELTSLCRKSLPNTIFYCFEGQITLFIMSFFGNTGNIADLTAMGRVAALLTVFSMTFFNVIAPRFARVTGQRGLVRVYLLAMLGTAAYVTPLVWFSWQFPKPLLYLLGSKYSDLGPELPWVTLSAALGQITAAAWTLNCARAWMRMRIIAYMPTVLVVQIVAALCLDLHRLHGMVIFGLFSVAAPLPLYLIDAWLGISAAAPKEVS